MLIKVILNHHESPSQASFTLPDNVRLGYDYLGAGPASCFQELPKNEVRQFPSPTVAVRLCGSPHFQETVQSNGQG